MSEKEEEDFVFILTFCGLTTVDEQTVKVVNVVGSACTSVRYQRNVNMLLGGNGLASKCDPDLVYLHLNIYLN